MEVRVRGETHMNNTVLEDDVQLRDLGRRQARGDERAGAVRHECEAHPGG